MVEENNNSAIGPVTKEHFGYEFAALCTAYGIEFTAQRARAYWERLKYFRADIFDWCMGRIYETQEAFPQVATFHRIVMEEQRCKIDGRLTKDYYGNWTYIPLIRTEDYK